MNILPKKKWHVRTKENMARVRRDEAKAAAEEAAVKERATLADHEDRVRRLKSKAADSYGSSMFDRSSTSGDGNTSKSGGHVNFFEELETQERQNLQQGNKEYEAEKKKEYNDWESKMGIMKRFAEDTKEYAKDKYWWECIPLVRKDITDGFTSNFAKNIVPSDPQQKLQKSTDVAPKVAPIMKHRICEHVGADAGQLPKPKRARMSGGATEYAFAGVDAATMNALSKKAKKKLREERHAERKRRKKERRRQRLSKQEGQNAKAEANNSDAALSSSLSCAVVEVPKNKAKKKKSRQAESSGKNDALSQLRSERLNREKAEKERAKALFQPKKETLPSPKIDLDSERNRKYNTQFNPEFAKR